MLKCEAMDPAYLQIYLLMFLMIQHLLQVHNKGDMQLLRMSQTRTKLQSSHKVKSGLMTMMRNGWLVQQVNHAKQAFNTIMTSRKQLGWNHGHYLKLRMSGNWHNG